MEQASAAAEVCSALRLEAGVDTQLRTSDWRGMMRLASQSQMGRMSSMLCMTDSARRRYMGIYELRVTIYEFEERRRGLGRWSS